MCRSKKRTNGRQLLDEQRPVQTPVMFFSLTNSPVTFQTMMNNIFKELIDEGVMIIYMDNILIFRKTEEQQWLVFFKFLISSGTTKLTSKLKSAHLDSLW